MNETERDAPGSKIGRHEGILASCVTLISLASLLGHLIDQTLLTNWTGPWSLTVPTALIYLILCGQCISSPGITRSILAYAAVLASIATLAADYPGYSNATGSVQTTLAISLLYPRKTYLSLLAIPAAWICVLGISVQILKIKPGTLEGFVANMSLPTAACGLSLVYLTAKAAEPFAFRKTPFRPVHIVYSFALPAAWITFPILFEHLGQQHRGLLVATGTLIIAGIALKEQFSKEKLLNRNKDLLKGLDEAAIATITDASGKIVHVNKAFTQCYGYTSDEAIGETHQKIASGRHEPAFWNQVWDSIKRGTTWKGEICNKTKEGQDVWLDTTIIPLLDESGAPELFLAIYFDITDRKLRAEDLKKSQEEQAIVVDSLRAMTAHRDRLVRMIAHDLRSPIASIITISENVKLLEQEISEQAAQNISQHAKKAMTELDDFLSVESQFHSLNGTSEIEDFDPILTTLQEWQIHSLIAEQKEIRIILPDTHSFRFRGPQLLFVHVLRNLLSNAIKFTPRNGKIAVDITMTTKGLTLVVEDSGIGISNERKKTLFEPFQNSKATPSPSQPQKSWGLGLSIIRELIKAKHGDIEISDSSLGGACFTVFFAGQ